MNNPFNKGDKVTTKIKGQVVEATVTQTFNQEVQVRTADNKLLWRVVKTVTLVEGAPIAAETSTLSQPEPTTEVPTPEARAGEPSTESATQANEEEESAPQPQADNRKSASSVSCQRTRGRRNR